MKCADVPLKRFLATTATLAVLAIAACTSDTETSDEKSTEREVSAPETSGDVVEQEASAEVPDPEHGKQVFTTTCATCHGADAEGVEGLGKKLVDSDYVRKSSDQELFELVRKGREPGHPQNETGIAMPPRGGNPALADQDLRDVVAYLRTLQ